ncbi:MAG: gliding motility lipoprotein GldH [Cyclobacteriaceae bacterium]|nr:gliding motility lipoprotein GldH [Cyclobacteriaceae bacterium]
MRLVPFFILLLLFGCDSNRVFERYEEFKDKAWKIQEPAEFEFTISDVSKKYNVLYNVRNSLDYPYARLFIEYTLSDSAGAVLSKKLLSNYLFDQKTGRPLGRSGLGDVYDHQFLLLQNQSFQTAGVYHMRLEQFNRLDTLTGILAIGVRVETVEME